MIKQFRNLRKGDVVRAIRPGDTAEHVWVILSTVKSFTHCVRACNFTSSDYAPGEVLINVSSFSLPMHWFRYRTERTFVRVNSSDCLTEDDVIGYLGNLGECCTELMEHICLYTYSCPVDAIDDLCDCNFEKIKAEIRVDAKSQPECGCLSSAHQ
ncbi:MAG: hypothetical protein BGO21_30920 [Dyadobacter sp. 50-39]|nr:MAG: hypothetical protein BGO21_30920 [Dyadobacter sp. 50-39]